MVRVLPGSQVLPVEPTWRLCLHSRRESPLEAEPPIEQSQVKPGIEDAKNLVLSRVWDRGCSDQQLSSSELQWSSSEAQWPSSKAQWPSSELQ